MEVTPAPLDLSPAGVAIAFLLQAALGAACLLDVGGLYIQYLALAVFLLTLGMAAAFYYHACVRTLPSGIATECIDKPIASCEETNVQPYPLVSGSVVGAAPEHTHDEKMFEFAEMINGLAELTTDLLEKREYLLEKIINPISAADQATSNKHYLSFVIDDELFAANILNIRCIVEATQLSTTSSVPPKLRRAIRLQDVLVPVIDLGMHFGCPPVEVNLGTGIVILDVVRDGHRQMLGVVVDAVCDVLQIAPMNIEPPKATDNEVRNNFTIGRAAVGNLTFTLLDIDQGFSANDLFLLSPSSQAIVKQASRYKPSHV